MESGTHSAIEKFIERVAAIREADYGDFMRRANLYLNELKKDLAPFVSGEDKRRIDRIQLHLQFTPSWKIESTRQQILESVIELDHSPTIH